MPRAVPFVVHNVGLFLFVIFNQPAVSSPFQNYSFWQTWAILNINRLQYKEISRCSAMPAKMDR